MMTERIPSARTVAIVVVAAAVLVVWQSVGWLVGPGRAGEDLRQARRTFEHVAPRAYRIEFSVGPCLCFSSHLRVTVVEGRIVRVDTMTPPRWDDPFPGHVLSTSSHLAQRDRWVERYVVFPRAFDVLGAMRDADVFEVSVDGSSGIPTRVYVDWRRQVLDDELTYHWRNLEVLDPSPNAARADRRKLP